MKKKRKKKKKKEIQHALLQLRVKKKNPGKGFEGNLRILATNILLVEPTAQWQRIICNSMGNLLAMRKKRVAASAGFEADLS